MKLVTFRRKGALPEVGLCSDDRVVGLAAAGYPDMLALLAAGEEGMRRAAEFAVSPPEEAVHELASVRLMAPIPRPPKIICVGLNYADHAKESNLPIPEVPTIFSKFPTTVIGPGDSIILPRNSAKPDYEAEMAVVIGKGGRHIAAEAWRGHVCGYTNFHDVSARDYQMATSQWLIGKTFDTFAPIGPYIVTADEVADPHQLDVRLILNGEVMQQSNTRHLIFRVPDLIAYLSSVFTLEPGDIISTGTPAGVGFARKPPRYLKPGDEVVVEVQGLGQLINPVEAEASA